MKRKVCKVGPCTLMVSLPSKWVRNMGIKQGDEMDVEEKDNLLIIGTDRKEQVESITLDLKGIKFKEVKSHKNLIRTIVGNLYKKGYDEIIVNFREDIKIEDIQDRIKLLLGMEILSSSKNSCIIKSILKGDPQEFDSIFRKLFQIIANKSKEIEETLNKKNGLTDMDIKDFRLTIEKLSDFLERLLSKDVSKDLNKIKHQKTIITTLEKVGREYIHLYNYILDQKITNFSKSLLEYIKEVNITFEFCYQHHYNFKLYESYKLAEKKNILIYKRGYDILQSCPRKETVIVHHLMNIVRRLWDIEGPLISIKF
ncbi:MAG: hypothetical protein KAI26_02440 [Nanoarchaeota archaeon]|nr:hypothetical protein [Nanoarchaeota archaeon]